MPLKSGDILSTDGETIVGMKDGVEYVLRFGAGTTVSGADKKEADDAKKADDKKDERQPEGVSTSCRTCLGRPPPAGVDPALRA